MDSDTLEDPIIASKSARETEAITTIPCAICRRQFSRYTCPRCNIPYCSLVCFRSEKHADCSESFYRKEVELDVKSAPSASTEEKRRMMDLLKRFEEDALEDSPLLGDNDSENEDDGEDDLQRRLQNMDIDSASYDELWSALTPTEREKFVRALEDPNSELAQQLLASEELEKAQVEPWWETPQDVQPDPDSTDAPAHTRRKHSVRPPIMTIPEPLVKQSSSTAVGGPLLLYNICALCVAYAYTVRHYAVSPLSSLSSTDPDHVEVRKAISHLVPFLSDRKSTLVHTSLSGVVTDLWSRFPSGHMNPQFLSLLFKDAAAILRPARVTVLTSPTQSAENLAQHPSANALRVLSDLISLYTRDQDSLEKAKPNHIAYKLTFYAAYLLGTPPPMLRVLVDEAMMRAKALESEGKQAERVGGDNSVRRIGDGKAATANIEEL